MHAGASGVPLLALCAEDDPVCAARDIHEHAGRIAGAPSTMLAVTRRGSHCAFFEGDRRPSSWAERVLAEYLRAVHALG